MADRFLAPISSPPRPALGGDISDRVDRRQSAAEHAATRFRIALPRGDRATLSLWAGAVTAALLAQLLITRGLDGHGRVIFLLAAGLAWIAFSRTGTAPIAGHTAPPPSAHRDWGRLRRTLVLTAIGGGLLSICAAAALVAFGAAGAAQWIWIASIGLLVAAAMLADGTRLPSSHSVKQGVPECAVLLLILATSVILTFARLDAMPPEIHGDEAATGLQAREIIHGARSSIFDEGRWRIPLVNLVFRVWTMQAFGDNLVGLRAGSAIQGVLAVLVLYLLARDLFGARVAALAGFLLAVAEWHIHFSRVGLTNVQALLATLLVLLFVVRGVRTGRTLDWLLAGLAIGFCAEIYLAARLAPIVAAIYVLRVAWIQRGFLTAQRMGLAAAFIGAVAFLAPMLPVLDDTSDNLVGRGPTVFVLAPANRQHELDLLGVSDTPHMLVIQAWRTLEAFNIFGDTSDQFHHGGAGLLDPWTAALLVVGAVAMIRYVREPRYLLLNAWVWLTLLIGGVLTVDAPFSPRLLVALPALVTLAAIALAAGWRMAERVFRRRGTLAFGVLASGLLALALVANYRDYFEAHVIYRQPAGLSTVFSRFVRDVNDRYRVYVVGPTQLSLAYDTPRFLIPKADVTEIPDGRIALPLTSIPDTKGAVFVFPSEETRPQKLVLDDLRAEYPEGQQETHQAANGQPLFTTYSVEHEQLATSADRRAACDAYQGARDQMDLLARCIGPAPDGD